MGITGDIPVQASPTKQNISEPKHDIPGVCRSTRVRTYTKSYSPILSGKKYSYAIALMENMGILHPESHMLFDQGITRHDPDVVLSIMTQLSLKAGLKRWGKKGRDEIHSETNQL